MPDSACVVAAAPSARQAHSSEHAESAIYRRIGEDPWQEIRTGLPERKEIRAPVVATNPAEPGVFYLAADSGLYRSDDGGVTWRRLEEHVGGSRVNVLVAISNRAVDARKPGTDFGGLLCYTQNLRRW